MKAASFVSRLGAPLAAAAVLMAAAPALAGPAPDTPLERLSKDFETTTWFLSPVETVDTDHRQLWILRADHERQWIGPDHIVGSWSHVVFDCRGHKASFGPPEPINEQLAIAWETDSEATEETIPPGSVGEMIFNHACKGKPLNSGPPRAYSLREAVVETGGELSELGPPIVVPSRNQP